MTTIPGKSQMRKAFLPALLIVTLVLAGLVAIKVLIPERQAPEPGAFELKLGEVAPDFTLTSVEGVETKFTEIEGSLFLINFWATWCEACLVEMPSISKLWDQYREKGLEVLAVNLDENADLAVSFARERLKLRFPIFIDPENRISSLFDVHGIPLTVILNRKGEVLFVETGERDWFSRDIRQRVEGWLSE